MGHHFSYSVRNTRRVLVVGWADVSFRTRDAVNNYLIHRHPEHPPAPGRDFKHEWHSDAEAAERRAEELALVHAADQPVLASPR